LADEKFINFDHMKQLAEAANADIDKEVSELEATLTPLIQVAQRTADANKYDHPDVNAVSSGLYKIQVDSDGHVISATKATKADIVALGIPGEDTDTDTTYSNATTSTAGLMSASDKSKLDGIASGANKYTHPSYTARTGVPTANATPAFGGTFTVSQPVSDASGHITAINSRTITIPKTEATTSAAGLMSASDKSKLNNMTAMGSVSVTLGISWTAQSDGCYAQTVSVSGVTASNQVIVDCALSGSDIDADLAVLEGWGYVNRATQAAGSLTFYCYSTAPTVAIPLSVVVG